MTTSKPRDPSRKPASAADSAAKRAARQPRTTGTSATAPAASSTAKSRKRKPQGDQVLARQRTLVLAALDDMKARDIHELDVRGRSDFADLMVLASGTSSRHVRSIAEEVVKQAKQAGLPPLGVEGEDEAEWVLVDLGDLVVHVMQPRTREFYGLERLWTVGDDLPEALEG